jgi:hypothetical protein
MPMNVHARFATTVTTVSIGRLAAVIGMMPVTKMPSAVRTALIRYHVLELSVVSAIGAQRNFQTLGARLAAMSAAMASTPTWFLASRNATATVR